MLNASAHRDLGRPELCSMARTALVSNPIVPVRLGTVPYRRVKLNAFLLADNLHLSRNVRERSVMISRILFWDSFSATALNALKASGASDLVVCTPHEGSRLRLYSLPPADFTCIGPAMSMRTRSRYSSARLRPSLCRKCTHAAHAYPLR